MNTLRLFEWVSHFMSTTIKGFLV